MFKFPSPTGATYYEFLKRMDLFMEYQKSLFPSPTGATYYESLPTKP